MKRFWKEILCAGVLGLLLPAMLAAPRRPDGAVAGKAALPEATTEPTTSAVQTEPKEQTVMVLTEEGVAEMPLEEYLVGVVLAEMPADFEMEAKKAQAVVARTYSLRSRDGRSKHETAAVCTNPACCQGYFPSQDYLSQGGSQEAVDAAVQAVGETAGLVLTYDGSLIEATYFSCSGGRTEDAVAVWGTDVPYLQSTDSPGEEGAAHFTDTVTFSAGEFTQAIGRELSGLPGTWLGEITYTDGGGVDSMEIGGESYTGKQLRDLLGLRSTAFMITPVGDSIIITTRGFGHRVGMSQYGADAMAAQGSGFEEILAHYYQGTELTAYH